MERPSIFIWRGGEKGGVEKTALVLAESFRKYWNLTPTLGVFKGSETGFPQLEVKRLFPEKLAGYNSAWGTFYLNRTGALNPFDIVFSHSGFPLKTKRNFYACYECGDLEKQLELIPRLSSLVATPVIRLHLSMMKKADLVIIPTEELEGFLRKQGISKYEVCPGGSYVDVKVFKPMRSPKPTSRFSLLFVGRIQDPRKNFGMLGRVCLKLKKKVELYVVDSGREKEERGNLHLLGGVSTQELVLWYNRCDLLVLPSFWEGVVPMVLLEALACEKPVLVSKYSVGRGLGKFVTTFNPFSEEDLERKILWVMKNYEEVREKAKEGSRYVRKNFEVNRVMKRMTTLILEHWRGKS